MCSINQNNIMHSGYPNINLFFVDVFHFFSHITGKRVVRFGKFSTLKFYQLSQRERTVRITLPRRTHAALSMSERPHFLRQ